MVVYLGAWIAVWVLEVPSAEVIFAVVIFTLVALVCYIGARKFLTAKAAEPSFRRERRRSQNFALGPDGKALVLGAPIRTSTSPIDPFLGDTDLGEEEVDTTLPEQVEAKEAEAATSKSHSADRHRKQPKAAPKHAKDSNRDALRQLAREKRASVHVIQSEDGLTLTLEHETFSTPLWGRSPKDAFRDLYAYALYHQSLDNS